MEIMEVISSSKEGQVILYKSNKIIYSKRFKVYYIDKKAFRTIRDAKKYIDNKDNDLIERNNYLEKEILDLQRENANLRKKIPRWKR